MPKAKKIHVLSCESESCDHYGPFLFEKMPSDAQLLEFLQEHVGDDAQQDDGPGWKDTYLHLSWSLQTIHNLG